MIFQEVSCRVHGLFTILVAACLGILLNANLAFAASKPDEVAVEHKTQGLSDFRLADYQAELLQCSALSAIHMWIGDNLGDNEGAEVRKALDEDYWLETSKDYIALAEQAAGKSDLTEQFGLEVRSLAAEWRHLTEDQVAVGDWQKWYELIDRCDSWRPNPPARSYFNNGRSSATASTQLSSRVPGVQ